MTITFNTDGTATCLHSDLIPLQTLGKLTVRRLSTVDFATDAQVWEVKTTRTVCGVAGVPFIHFCHPSREVCLDWEREHWEELL